MTDQSSESSEEWVVLNESDELSLAEEQPLNLQLSYAAVCDAVSESIRSSLSSEELEWQYEQFQDFIPLCRPSCIEELDYSNFDAESTEDLNVNLSESDDSAKCTSACDFEDDKNIEISAVSKSHCYKHTRNDHLNFVLNLMLALVLASAIGLGIGHFLGWSHKCYKGTSEHDSAYSSKFPDVVIHSPQLPHAVSIMQNVENFIDQEKEVLSPTPLSENLSDISCLDPKDSGSSMHQEICKSQMNNDIAINAVLPEASIFMSEDVQELKTGEINQNNFSDIGLNHVSNIVTHIEWNKIVHNTESFENLNEPLERSDSQGVPSTDTEKSTYQKILPFGLSKKPLTDTEESISDVLSPFSSDSLGSKDAVNNAKIELLKQVYINDNEAYKESNLTNKLRQDLSQVIQSLSAIALARLTHVSDNILIVQNSEMIVKYYSDFENLVNLKLSEIDNFVMSAEYKKYERISVKHLQKMVYTLIDSVDYLMKVSIKTLSRDNKRINVHKYLNNIAKVTFNFNKKWEKNSRYWFEILEKMKFQEVRENFKKESKHGKRKSQFEKEYRNNKFQRYSMKS